MLEVAEENVNNFNFVAGCVPSIQQLLHSVRQRVFLLATLNVFCVVCSYSFAASRPAQQLVTPRYRLNDLTSIRRAFDCLSKVTKFTVT